MDRLTFLDERCDEFAGRFAAEVGWQVPRIGAGFAVDKPFEAERVGIRVAGSRAR